MINRIGAARQPAFAVPLPPTLELGACYRYCEALCRARHHNYPVASMFARSHLRKHIFALFAFARVADDFADERAYEGRRARELDRWEEQLHDAYRVDKRGGPTFDRVMRGLELLREHHVDVNILCTLHAANVGELAPYAASR